jgi:hypothetical protein
MNSFTRGLLAGASLALLSFSAHAPLSSAHAQGTLRIAMTAGDLPVTAGQGANPQLPAPKSTLLPTVKVADITGWPAGARFCWTTCVTSASCCAFPGT